MTVLKGYHAHVYFDTATRQIAERLRDAIVSNFAVEAGAFCDEPRGPHPIPQFSVVVHPLTESNYDDHTVYAMWLGTPVALRLDRLSAKLPESLLPTAQRA